MDNIEAINRLSFIRCALLGGTKPQINPDETNVELFDKAIEAMEIQEALKKCISGGTIDMMKEYVEKLIERLEKEILASTECKAEAIADMCGSSVEHYCGEIYAYNKAKEIVNKITEEYDNGWIPCEKKLPPQPNENPVFENKPLELYMVSVEHADYPIRAFWNGKIFTDGWGKVEAVAWQPLPEVYKASK